MYDEQNEQCEYDLDIENILEEYHRKKLLENMTGPSTSVILHIIVLSLMFIYMVTTPTVAPPAIEVSIVEEEVKEIEPEILDEIDPTDEVTVDEIPTEVPSDAPSDDAGVDTSPVDINDDAAETNDDMDTNDVLDVIATNSPLTLSGFYGGRSDGGRKKAVGKYGGGKPGQNSVNKALKWLASVQNADGSWGGTPSPAHTGMALLVFLAHGETPMSEKYGNTVQGAMKWLADSFNNKDDGDLGQKSYGHGIATYAICESYGMTKIPFVRMAMEKALGVIIYGQQDGGGFNYGYSKGARWDLSVAGWQFQALKAGYVSGASNAGLEEAIRKSVKFCQKTAYANGKFGYSSAGRGGNMTGVGTVALQLLGQGKCNEVLKASDTIATERFALYKKIYDDPSQWDAVAGHNLYGMYYDTQAMFNAQTDKKGKAMWNKWRPVFEKVLVDHQQPEGYWEVAKGHGLGANLNGRIMATCWSALQLEVYYRYLPTFDIGKMDKHVVTTEGNSLEDASDGGLVIDIE